MTYYKIQCQLFPRIALVILSKSMPLIFLIHKTVFFFFKKKFHLSTNGQKKITYCLEWLCVPEARGTDLSIPLQVTATILFSP